MRNPVQRPARCLQLDSPPRSERGSGFTLVEVTIALVLLSLTILGFGASYVVNSRSSDNLSEKSLVLHTFRQLAERMRSAPFGDIVTNYQGLTFTIPEINASGSITIYVDETTNTADGHLLGLPRDLNGDGNATSANVSASYLLLPIKIEASYADPILTKTEKLFLLMAEENN